MKNTKYIKACPFLRDFGGEYLCVNNDDVTEIELDPLINIEWSDNLKPVASEADEIETCLFIIEVMDDGKLHCISRDMDLILDGKPIYWEDIRDSIILLNMDQQEESQNAEIDFCSTCLYKVLLASSPAFQQRMDFSEKVKLGKEYLLNRSKDMIQKIAILVNDISKSNENFNSILDSYEESEKANINIFYDMMGEIFLKIAPKTGLFDIWVNWLQQFEDWITANHLIEEATDKTKIISNIMTSKENAERVKEVSYNLLMKASFVLAKYKEKQDIINIINRIFTRVCIHFEDYVFICSQFLKNVSNNNND